MCTPLDNASCQLRKIECSGRVDERRRSTFEDIAGALRSLFADARTSARRFSVACSVAHGLAAGGSGDCRMSSTLKFSGLLGGDDTVAAAALERPWWFGLTALVGGVWAISVSWLDPDLSSIWCRPPRRSR
jgi:hypothetical protein